MPQPSVFLSHSTKDAAFTSRLEADLNAAGATVYRVSADAGGDFQRRINEALTACEYVVLVLTKDAINSPWVEQEIHAAIRLKNQGRIKDIIPIQANKLNQRDIPPLWAVYNVFDASSDYASARDALARAVGLAVAAAAPPHVSSPPSRVDSRKPLFMRGKTKVVIGYLVVIDAGATNLHPGARLEIEPITSIGRSPANTIQLDTGFISTEHTRIVYRDRSLWVEDMGSRNGTLVDGTLVSDPVAVTPGTILQVGDVRFKFSV